MISKQTYKYSIDHESNYRTDYTSVDDSILTIANVCAGVPKEKAKK